MWRKTRRARGEGSRPARTPGDGVSGARDGGLGPRGSGTSDAMDTDVSETKHRAVRGVARAVEAVGSHRQRRGATARGTLIARTGPPLMSRARGRMTTDSWGCRRDRHINEHAMNLASVRVRRRVVSPRRRRPRCPAEVPAKIYAARCFAGPDVCRVGRVPCRWSGSTAPGQSRTPARAHPSRCGERSAWLLAIRAGNAQV